MTWIVTVTVKGMSASNTNSLSSRPTPRKQTVRQAANCVLQYSVLVEHGSRQRLEPGTLRPAPGQAPLPTRRPSHPTHQLHLHGPSESPTVSLCIPGYEVHGTLYLLVTVAESGIAA